jgi:hypothetical protein
MAPKSNRLAQAVLCLSMRCVGVCQNGRLRSVAMFFRDVHRKLSMEVAKGTSRLDKENAF